MHLQKFWVGRQGEPEVEEVHLEGIENANVSLQLREAYQKNSCVVIGPSNPISSIGPILHVKGMLSLISKRNVVAVSPLIGDKAVSGPAKKLMRAWGVEPTSVGVGQLYDGLADILVLDTQDDTPSTEFPMDIIRTDTLMVSKEKSIELAHTIIGILKEMN